MDFNEEKAESILMATERESEQKLEKPCMDVLPFKAPFEPINSTHVCFATTHKALLQFWLMSSEKIYENSRKDARAF